MPRRPQPGLQRSLLRRARLSRARLTRPRLTRAKLKRASLKRVKPRRRPSLHQRRSRRHSLQPLQPRRPATPPRRLTTTTGRNSEPATLSASVLPASVSQDADKKMTDTEVSVELGGRTGN
ncbi:pentapeptide repeat-containing protein [uncultured Ferrovibrio sp.]|uniref:pentapeptide repeat-containing protein n=1 Tax=uncultured Ferrovibrio sp. TaxID=1576913 RepID=UPI00341BE960